MKSESYYAREVVFNYLMFRCPHGEKIGEEILEDAMDFVMESDLIQICRNLPYIVTRDYLIEAAIDLMLLYNMIGGQMACSQTRD